MFYKFNNVSDLLKHFLRVSIAMVWEVVKDGDVKKKKTLGLVCLLQPEVNFPSTFENYPFKLSLSTVLL